MRRAFALLLAGMVAGCSGAEEEEAATTTTSPRAVPAPAVRPVRLVRTPAWADRVCRSSRLLRPICPRRIPEARYRRGGLRLAPVGPPGRRFDFLVLAGERTRRPREVRLVLLASRYGLGRSVGGVFSSWDTQRRARVRWGRVRAELVHDRSDPSVRAGRLVARWQARGVDYAVAVRAWKPAPQAVATLRAVVASAPGPRRR